MKSASIKYFVSNKHFIISALTSMALFMIAFSFAYINLIPQEGKIILHYNVQNEIDILGTAGNVWLMIVILAVIAVVNFSISYSLYFREKVLSFIVMYSTSWIMALGALVFYSLSQIN